jgi:hypothetical protein
MTETQTHTAFGERIHPLGPTLMAFSGLALLFVGERVLSGFDTARVVLAIFAAACLLGATILRFIEFGHAPDDRRSVARLLFLTTAGMLIGALLYAPLGLSSDGQAKWRPILVGLWPVVIACSSLPLFLMELAVLPVARIARYEKRRVRLAFERGLSLALLLSVAFVGNFLAKRHDVKTDLSLGKKAQATEGTQRIVRGLSQPIRVVLFFPAANEVAEALEPYFDSLRGLSPKLTIERRDQALAFTLASETGVNENGFVVVSHDKTHEKIRLGVTLRSTRSTLRTFDTDFAKAVVKVTREKSVAYFTAGHGERATDPAPDDKRPPVTLLKTILKTNQYDVKPLGVAEGLAADVPKDASVLFMIGPEKPFLPDEVESLRRAVKKGVRMLVMIDPDRSDDAAASLQPLLADLGLKFDKTLLVNDQAFVRVNYNDADKEYIYSNHYSSHASVTTMTRNSNKLATLFARSGSLDKIEPAPPNTRTDVVLRALESTFGDKAGTLTFAPPDERKAWGLAAAVTRTATVGKEESRIFVLPDADVFSDTFVRFQGNPYLLDDVISWLRDVKDPVLPSVTEEDVRIVHKRDEDALWFYSTTFGAPALVALFGMVVVGRRRRKS